MQADLEASSEESRLQTRVRVRSASAWFRQNKADGRPAESLQHECSSVDRAAKMTRALSTVTPKHLLLKHPLLLVQGFHQKLHRLNLILEMEQRWSLVGIVRGAPHWSPKWAMSWWVRNFGQVSQARLGKTFYLWSWLYAWRHVFSLKWTNTNCWEDLGVNIIVCCSLEIICKWNKIIRG